MTFAPRGPVPVFPLPGVVLFPHAVLPLRVFELRYRTLLRDALAGERQIAMATLRPGWEADYEGSPAFHDLGCVGACEDVTWQPDDCYQLSVRGLSRVRFTGQAREFPYRACTVEALPEAPYAEDDPVTALVRRELMEACSRLLPLGGEAWLMPPLLEPDAAYERMVATLAQCLRLPGEDKLELLALDSVIERGRRLVERMRRFAPPPRRPPPPRGEHN